MCSSLQHCPQSMETPWAWWCLGYGNWFYQTHTIKFLNFVPPNQRDIDDDGKEVMKTTELFDYLLIHMSQQCRMWFIINVIQEMEKVLNYKGRHTFKMSQKWGQV